MYVSSNLHLYLTYHLMRKLQVEAFLNLRSLLLSSLDIQIGRFPRSRAFLWAAASTTSGRCWGRWPMTSSGPETWPWRRFPPSSELWQGGQVLRYLNLYIIVSGLPMYIHKMVAIVHMYRCINGYIVLLFVNTCMYVCIRAYIGTYIRNECDMGIH
jgi:hypothetical protein